MNRFTLALLAAGLLGGCATTRSSSVGPWNWTPDTRLAQGNSGSSGAVVIPPGRSSMSFYAYAGEPAPEYDRRDGALSLRTEAPTGPRPSLEYQRSFRTGRDADRYVYPTVPDPYYRYPRHYPHHSPYRGPYRRVR